MKKRRFERNVVAVDDRENQVSGFEHLPNHQPFAGFSPCVEGNVPQAPKKLHETQGKQKQERPELYPYGRFDFTHSALLLVHGIQHTFRTTFETPAGSTGARDCLWF